VAVTDMPLLGMLRTKMQWHQARQKLLAENVANVGVGDVLGQELLAQPSFDRSTGLAASTGSAMTLTSVGHIAASGDTGVGADPRRVTEFEIRPSGNGVNLEDEMMKSGDNQSDYQLAASMYQKSLDVLKIAIGKK
jgi:flagellar basal-body rod protein FlgB